MASKSKHYTAIEKSLFLQILNKYKNVIECKKSNINTLREKEVAWTNVCEEFNNSSLIAQERSIQQLKKLWTNIKQTQRDIITKEKQARFATGGGPEIPFTELDPEVASIAPALMATAPVLFSSNMNENELEDQRQIVQDKCMSSNGDIELEINEMTENDNNKENEEPLITCVSNISIPKEIGDNMTIKTSKIIKKRKFTETEDEVKIERIRNIMEQEQQLGEAKLKHEQTMATIKETHVKEINKLEVRASLAKAELAELMLKKERDRI